MASEESRRIVRAVKLVEMLRELQAKTYELTEEVQKILAGEVAIGDTLKRLETLFSDEWQRLYGSRYVFQFARDRPHWKRLIKQTSETVVIARVMAYVNDRDPYLLRARHPFGLFVSRFNTYTVEAAQDFTLGAPRDCRHQPPCASDQEHTKRQVADTRGSDWGGHGI